MSLATLYRMSGIALLLGTLLTVLFVILGPFVLGEIPLNGVFPAHVLTPFAGEHQSTFTNPLWVPVNLLLLLGAMLLVAGLYGMYASMARRAGWTGLVGFVLTLVAVLMSGVVDQAFTTFALPFIALYAPQVVLTASQFPALEAFSLVASLLFSLGALLLGLATMRARVLSRGQAESVGVALIVAAICNAVPLVPLSNSLREIDLIGSLIGTLAFFVGLAVAGYCLVLWRRAAGVRLSLITPLDRNTEVGHL